MPAAKPCCDYDDPQARIELVDALAKDSLALLEGRELDETVSQVAALLATVLGQDLDRDETGVFRIARRVAKDRVISTVDPAGQARAQDRGPRIRRLPRPCRARPGQRDHHRHHVSAGNAGDASVAHDLITDLLEAETADAETADDGGDGESVYGDNAYGTGEFHDRLEQAGIESKCKTQSPTAAGGLFVKDRFDIDLAHDSVTCPAGQTAPIRRAADGTGTARFGDACTGCPLREQCTKSATGRSVSVGTHEQQLADARTRQQHPHWVADYRATRPKVERKIGHLMRRHHGLVVPESTAKPRSPPTSPCSPPQ